MGFLSGAREVCIRSGSQGGIDTFRAKEPVGAGRDWGRGWVENVPRDGRGAISQLSG